MPHYRSLNGKLFALVICEARKDDWKIQKIVQRTVVLQRIDDPTDMRSISTQVPATVKRVKNFCKSLGITAEEFEQALATVGAGATIEPGEPTPPPPTQLPPGHIPKGIH